MLLAIELLGGLFCDIPDVLSPSVAVSFPMSLLFSSNQTAIIVQPVRLFWNYSFCLALLSLLKNKSKTQRLLQKKHNASLGGHFQARAIRSGCLLGAMNTTIHPEGLDKKVYRY